MENRPKKPQISFKNAQNGILMELKSTGKEGKRAKNRPKCGY